MRIALITLFSVFTLFSFGQSKTAEKFHEGSKGKKLFAYQSVIRMLNQENDPDFDMLIRDLDHVRIAISDSIGYGAKETYQRLDEGVQSEGFEEIMSVRKGQLEFKIYESAARKSKSTWIAAFYMDGMAGILEMVGSLDIRYLSALSGMDFNSAIDLIK